MNDPVADNNVLRPDLRPLKTNRRVSGFTHNPRKAWQAFGPTPSGMADGAIGVQEGTSWVHRDEDDRNALRWTLSNGLQPREGSDPTIWTQTGVAAIEFHSGAP
jgi:hypothetical protein